MGVTTEVQVKILIVEDDPDICDLLKRVLEADGYEVETVSDSAGALKAVADGAPDLVLLDVVLGGEDGRDLLVKLRQKSDVPAVFLTGRGLEGDRIAGLRMGADDYIVKPFSRGELSARIETVLRRTRPSSAPEAKASTTALSFGELKIDLTTPGGRAFRRAHRADRHGVQPSRLPRLVTPAGVLPATAAAERVVFLE